MHSNCCSELNERNECVTCVFQHNSLIRTAQNNLSARKSIYMVHQFQIGKHEKESATKRNIWWATNRLHSFCSSRVAISSVYLKTIKLCCACRRSTVQVLIKMEHGLVSSCLLNSQQSRELWHRNTEENLVELSSDGCGKCTGKLCLTIMCYPIRSIFWWRQQ